MSFPIQPRVCGDTTFYLTGGATNDDTTPRMRGYFLDGEFVPHYARYNPAYAGILENANIMVYFIWIQPRVCGDTSEDRKGVTAAMDTTPRMRGY